MASGRGVSRTEREADVRRLVETRWGALVRFGVLMTGDVGHAEDLVQAALEKCWPRWVKIRTDSPERYVKAAMVNLSVSRWRRRRVREVADTHRDGARPDGSDLTCEWTDATAESVAARDEVWRLLATLPPRMRAVVVLRYVEDLSEAETARLLGVSVGTVKSQSSRALQQLRIALTDEPSLRAPGVTR